MNTTEFLPGVKERARHYAGSSYAVLRRQARRGLKVGRRQVKRALKRANKRLRPIKKDFDARAKWMAPTVAEYRLRRIADSGRPIVVGPWLGEVGWEALVWIPFVRWFADRYEIEPERITVVSRGGAGIWYGDLGHRYLDVLDYATPEELRIWGPKMQLTLQDHEREMLRRAGPALGEGSFSLLHPSVMNGFFRDVSGLYGIKQAPRPFFLPARPLTRVLDHSNYVRLDLPASPAMKGLPEDYVAVKAYFNLTFPDTPENQGFLRSFVERLARTTNVVLLANPVAMDEHLPWHPDAQAGVYSIDHLMTTRDNLAVQTRVLAGASALFAPVGGFSHLSIFLGVPVFAFHSQIPRGADTQVELARLALRRLGRSWDAARLTTFDFRDLDRLDAFRGVS